MSEPILEYDHLYQFITQRKLATIDRNCNAWTIINIGTTVCEVNGVPLNPGTPGVNNGESYVSPGNRNEIFRGRIDVQFPAGNVGRVVFIQKIYTNRSC